MGSKSSSSSSSAPSNYRTASAFPSSARLGRVWVSLRRIACIFGSPNHWAVIIDVIGFGFINVQFGDDYLIISYHPTMADAARATRGCKICDIRTSCYDRARVGLTVGDLNDYVARLERGRYDEYCFFFNDCQNFARSVVDWLNGKYVGPGPIENGPDFHY